MGFKKVVRVLTCHVFVVDILKVLQDLDETSLHSVEILKHFVVRVALVELHQM